MRPLQRLKERCPSGEVYAIHNAVQDRPPQGVQECSVNIDPCCRENWWSNNGLDRSLYNAGTPHLRQRQMHPELQFLHAPAAIATVPQNAAEPRFAWNFFETTVKATEDVRIRGNVAQGGELQS